jgi:hypothetical protein
MTTSGSEFVCENCAQSFRINLVTVVRIQAESSDGSGRELTFHVLNAQRNTLPG